jgi:RNA polymerase sigma-70 factor (ECF subfamily)
MIDQISPQRIDPDAALIKSAQAELPHGTAAFEELVRSHQRLIFGVCLRLLGNPADADDVCQEVLLKVFHSLKKFEGRSLFKTWLMSIVVNACSTARVQRQRSRDTKNRLAAEPAAHYSKDISTEELDANTLLRHLAAEERELLILRFVADLSFEEIAEVSGIGLSAAKMRVYRAADRLRSIAAELDN